MLTIFGLAMNTEIVARMADACARVLYRHEIEAKLRYWRTPFGMMESWGVNENEVKEALEIAIGMADENPKRPRKKDGSLI